MASSRDRVRRAERRNTGSDLAARIVAALPAIAFAIAIVWAGGWVFTAGLVALGWICLGELFGMLRAGNPVRLAGFVGLTAMLIVAHTSGRPGVLAVLAACVPLMFVVAVVQPRAGAPGISVTSLALIWLALALAHAVMLRDLPHGNAVIVGVLVGTFVGDTGAYLGGRAFGRRKLAPVISPSKTLEGLGIGMLTAVASVWFAGFYWDWMSGVQAIGLGLAVAVAAPVGDLFESYLKRDAGTKDTGRIFGPHGGALDRLDAALFSIPVGFYVWQAML